MKFSIFLPSFNKPEYVLDAIESVVLQDYPDWELWILENSTDNVTRQKIEESGLLDGGTIHYEKIDMGALRQRVWPPAYLVNMYYPRATGDFIIFLADDDLLSPDCLEKCQKHFLAYPDHDAAYFGMNRVGIENSETEDFGPVLADHPRGKGELGSIIDGGQVVHRKYCLIYIDYPYAPDTIDDKTHYSDAILIEKIAEHFTFYPIPEVLATHRYTPISNWVSYIKAFGGRCHVSSRHYEWMNH